MYAPHGSGGEKIAKKNTVDLEAIANESQFEETLRPHDLVGKSFTINSVKSINGEFGQNYVGEITVDGSEREAFLSGNVVTRQLDALVDANGFPVDVTLERDASKFGEPFVLRAN